MGEVVKVIRRHSPSGANNTRTRDVMLERILSTLLLGCIATHKMRPIATASGVVCLCVCAAGHEREPCKSG